MMWRLSVLVVSAALFVLAACSAPDTRDECLGGCPGGYACVAGSCVPSADPCDEVVCPDGVPCIDGICRPTDRCDGVVCGNPGEVCDPRDGACVQGDSDGDGDGVTIAGGDCDDSDAAVHPGALEVCNGADDDCEADTLDGDDECAGYCCGDPPACGDCCDASQCGAGDWACVAGACTCEGWTVGDECYAGGTECAPGDVDDQTDGCEMCGIRTRSRACTPEGTWGDWGDWSDCTRRGECSPGDRDSDDCGDCGTRSRTCGDDCTWGGWSACTREGECSRGTSYSDTGTCGTCGGGTRTRTVTCSSTCEWSYGSWSACSGDIYCTDAFGDTVCPGDAGFRTCPSNPDGVQDCTCSSSGNWTSCTPGCIL